MSKAKYRNGHLRKQRHTLTEWLKYVANLDRAERRHERKHIERGRYPEYVWIMGSLVHKDEAEYYWNAFISPARNCSPLAQRLQRLTGAKLESEVNSILRNGLR